MKIMKKITSFLCLAIVIITTVMAAVPEVRAEEKGDTEDSVFQKASDVINGKYEVKTVPFKKIGVFQRMSDAIDEIERSDK